MSNYYKIVIKPLDDFIKGILVGSFVVAASVWAIVLLSGCSTHTIQTPAVNATSTAFLYCPEALVMQIDGKRVSLGAESSGVGAVVRDVAGASQ